MRTINGGIVSVKVTLEEHLIFKEISIGTNSPRPSPTRNHAEVSINKDDAGDCHQNHQESAHTYTYSDESIMMEFWHIYSKSW